MGDCGGEWGLGRYERWGLGVVRGVGVGDVVGVDVGLLGWGGWGAVGERHDVVFVWEDFGEAVEP